MPKLTATVTRSLTPKERVLLYAVPDSDTQCWNWSGYVDRDGYGKLTLNNHPEMAHRVSWEAHFGPIQSGMFVCHRCDNPRCVNPAHLFVGTAKDNNDDMCSKGRAARQQGEQHGAAKLTEKQALEIYRRANNGEIRRHLAREFGVSPMTISNIANGRRWRHVTEKAA